MKWLDLEMASSINILITKLVIDHRIFGLPKEFVLGKKDNCMYPVKPEMTLLWCGPSVTDTINKNVIRLNETKYE